MSKKFIEQCAGKRTQPTSEEAEKKFFYIKKARCEYEKKCWKKLSKAERPPIACTFIFRRRVLKKWYFYTNSFSFLSSPLTRLLPRTHQMPRKKNKARQQQVELERKRKIPSSFLGSCEMLAMFMHSIWILIKWHAQDASGFVLSTQGFVTHWGVAVEESASSVRLTSIRDKLNAKRWAKHKQKRVLFSWKKKADEREFIIYLLGIRIWTLFCMFSAFVVTVGSENVLIAAMGRRRGEED